MNIKENGRLVVEKLVQKFKENITDYKDSTYNETKVRTDFINPFLEALGWDVYNNKGSKQHLREVEEEDTVDISEDGKIKKKKPDYALRYDGNRKVFVEVKKPSVQIKTDRDPAFQIRRYGWSAQLPVSLLTNFETMIVYDCRYRPEEGDDVRVARIREYNYEEFIENYDEIYDEFSQEAVSSGLLDQKYNIESEIYGNQTFDKYFLTQIEKWREMLGRNIIQLNNNLEQLEVNFLVQRIINRIVFLRICEDRDLEKYKGLLEIESYEGLKSLFERADKKYNSGLFDFIDDRLSLNIEIDSELLINIFQELYYPKSPYTFSVVESNVLGEIYELFLAKQIKVNPDSTIEIEEKPEISESNGVVTTPRHIVDSIIEKTLGPLLANKPPAEALNIKVADISCGSGIFLLGTYEYLLNFHLQWYLDNSPEDYPNKVYQKGNGEWHLNLLEKQNILLNNIYGVDIDSQAVEVTQFSLLLKVLEDESDIALEYLLNHHKLKALPNLKGNIVFGNSLVDYKFYDLEYYNDLSEEVLYKVNPFNWETEFVEIFEDGGFDAIIGNPPYIRIQNMMKYSSEEVQYYRSSVAGYKCAEHENFDKYSLFLERSLALLKPSGMLGYIVPNKFFTIKSGKALRQVITENNHLKEIVHFGVEQVFKNRSTYTCLIVLSKFGTEEFVVEHVSDLEAWKYGEHLPAQVHNSSDFNEEPWVFLHPSLKGLFEKISLDKEPLKNFSEIFVGVQTSKDDIYVIKPTNETEDIVEFIAKDGQTYQMEKGVLRPFLLDVAFEGYLQPSSNAYLIYPYKEFNGRKAIPYTEIELMEEYPCCYEYLLNHKESLLKRSVQGYTDETWFRFGRSQSLTKFNGIPKLIWPVLSLDPKYTYDDENIIFSGGGNGPYYGLRTLQEDNHSIFYILAVLSHPAIEAIIKTGKTSRFRGGYYSHGKQFIEGLPFKNIDFQNEAETHYHDSIVQNVQILIEIKKQLSFASLYQQRERLKRRAEIVNKRINSHIEALYNITEHDMEIINELL
ncbi:Eco57I restriction-modification methylase domain-containing protein [Peribacillus butanolivorans]|uniref:Eco57I restriction-modification methylase domain-containing protein n=1 Tax=Peribacillus butanolivorans TaxID=421767 RepID=UPI00207CB400|nr:Eco57I restriction-modification methylase domain-containing protein [Peribacillus butanolivorans]MCO0598513.1 Eco57I restriction-modification methylase domain-containing protein [Peribacillus butanolivorans]